MAGRPLDTDTNTRSQGKTMRAYLIDTPNKQITEVDYDGDYKSIYTWCNVECFTTVRINADDDVVFLDDEGLINGNPDGWFVFSGYNQPLRGKGLVLGTDNEGESVEPTIALEELRSMITFPSDEEVGCVEPYFHVTSWM
jgi:hypothetical protein